jgi:signal peptidase II
MPRRKTHYIAMAVAGLVIVVLDQLSKLWIAANIERGGVIEVIPGFGRLRYTQNSGAAFGLFQDATGILSILSLLIIIGILVVFVRVGQPGRFGALAAGLVLGGAMGNLIDRVRLGYVVDFFEVYGPRVEFNSRVYTFPVFNVADSAITVGVIIILVGLLFTREEEPQQVAAPSTAPIAPQQLRANYDSSAWRATHTGSDGTPPATEQTTPTTTLRNPTPAGWAGAAIVMLGFAIMALRSASRSEGR